MQGFNKLDKFPKHWSSKIPIRYKRNAAIGELRRAKRTAFNFDKKNTRIREKYRNAGFHRILLLELSAILKKN